MVAAFHGAVAQFQVLVGNGQIVGVALQLRIRGADGLFSLFALADIAIDPQNGDRLAAHAAYLNTPAVDRDEDAIATGVYQFAIPAPALIEGRFLILKRGGEACLQQCMRVLPNSLRGGPAVELLRPPIPLLDAPG